MDETKKTPRPKIAFCLAGGGAAGAFQFGCLKAVYERSSLRPDFMTANSAGALNATGLSYGSIEELEKLWRSITKRQDIFGDRFLGWLMPLFGANSLWTSKPLKKKLDGIMAGRSPKIPYWVNYTNLQDGQLYRDHSSSGKFADKVLSSASLPVITEPVQGILVDGGIRENTPIGFAIDQGATDVYVFLNSSNVKNSRIPFKKTFSDVKEVAARTLNIMSDELYWGDVAVVEKYNKHGIGRKVNIQYFAPRFNTIDTLDFKADKISAAIQQGFLEACAKLSALKIS